MESGQVLSDRREGFLAAAHAAGAETEVVEGDFSERSGFDAIAGRAFGAGRFDGIVFANDDMAFGGLQALRRDGWRAPDDVAVVGFDDFGLARTTDPGITTMHVDAEAVGRIATDRLFALVDAPSTPPARDELPVALVRRASCGCPPPDVELLHD